MKVFKTEAGEYIIKYRGHTYALNTSGWFTYSTIKHSIKKATESSLLDILITSGKSREQIETTLSGLHKQLEELPPSSKKYVYQGWSIGAVDGNAKSEDTAEFNFSVKFTDKNEVVITDESRASPTTSTPDSCASPGSKMEKS